MPLGENYWSHTEGSAGAQRDGNAQHSSDPKRSTRLDAIGLSLQTDDPRPKPRPRKTVQEIVDRADMDADVAVAGRCCTSIFLPLLLLVVIVGTIGAVLATSGGAPAAEGTPRAALFLFEGFKGTAFDALLRAERLPHIHRMLREQRGVHAACTSLEDIRCARAVPVEDDLTGEAFLSAGAGLASVLTGVAPRRHGVREDGWASYRVLAETSARFPTVCRRLTRAGRRAAAVGSAHLLNSLNDANGQCSEPGVLDAECDGGAEAEGMTCVQQRGCNLHRRLLAMPAAAEVEERHFTKQLTDLLGADAGAAGDDTLIVFHFSALARGAAEAARPDFTYSADSMEYAATAFRIDSLVGQVLAVLKGRARAQKENWLVVGTSDHGGAGKTFGRLGDEDEVVPFFVATYTTNTQGYTTLQPLKRPVTHMDAAATILSWLGMEPFAESDDDETDGTEANVSLLDGHPQAFCGSGKHPMDCKETS